MIAFSLLLRFPRLARQRASAMTDEYDIEAVLQYMLHRLPSSVS
jgi:hypothetical protein